MSTPYLIGATVLLFLACFLAVYGGGDWVAARLSQEASVYEKFIGKKLRRLFLSITPQEFIIGHIIFIIVAIALASYGLGGVLLGIPLGLGVGVIIPSIWLDMQWNSRLKMVEEQVEEALVYMANSFKANPSLPEAFQDVCNSMGPPITQEISVMLREYKLGTPLDQALINLQKRVPARNLQLAVAALLVGRTVGGNIPKILEDTSTTIRESYRLERVIDTQTAQGRMQAWVMGSAPAAICVVFYLMDKTLIEPLFNNFIGYCILAVAVAFNVVGVVLILKIVAIDV
ncbi:MAG: type II secretion system F family protein [Myxococcota bacterium]|jgi:tight adherence protein B|nr:type II secretion system F family protein [Myxococcota bacterium]